MVGERRLKVEGERGPGGARLNPGGIDPSWEVGKPFHLSLQARRCHGFECMVKGLGFLVSLVSKH
jgi:hypothetical protein